MKISMILISLFFFTACVRPSAPTPDAAPDSYQSASASKTDFLIYEGPGSWRAELRSLKNILYSNGATYETLSPDKINRLSRKDFEKYNAIMFVGGNARTVRKNLSKDTRALIREAVQMQGLNYLGFCAGAWLAVAPEPSLNEDVVAGIGVVSGPLLNITSLEKQGLHYSLDKSIFPDGSRKNLLWYGGPITPDIPGGVIAKYSDGTPAISQIRSGRGMVIISGLHPAATRSILRSINLEDREAIDPVFTWDLLKATINGTSLPAF